MTVTSETTTMNSLISDLSSKLIAIAKSVSCRMPGEDWEDIYQIMVAALLERDVVDPDFVKQMPAYILKYASFVASHAAQKTKVYLKYVDIEGDEIDPEDADSSENFALDLRVDRERLLQALQGVENQVMNDELGEDILKGCDWLSGKNLLIVCMLYEGYKKSEIAKALKISRPAVTQRIQTIANTLQGFIEY